VAHIVAPVTQRPAGAAREHRASPSASKRGGDSGDSDPSEPEPALAGPSPRFSRPWRDVDEVVAERRRALDALTGGTP
jgi:hypothetical protein